MAVSRLTVVALVACGCFSPKYPEGLACGDGNDPCPPGQTCALDGHCHASALEPDAADHDAASDAAPLAWSTPVRIAELSTTDADQDPALDGTLLTIVFASDRPGGKGGSDLWTATRTSIGAPFENVAPIAELSSSFDEFHPWLSPDGNTIYFESSRTGGGDIYTSTRTGTQWAAPSPVTAVNKDTKFEGGVGLPADQEFMLFASDRGGNRDLYRSIHDLTTGTWDTPILAASVSSPDIESGPAMSADELYFMRQNAAGDNQIFRAHRNRVTFDAPERVTELELAADPWVSDDGHTMFLTKMLDLYVSTR